MSIAGNVEYRNITKTSWDAGKPGGWKARNKKKKMHE